MTAKKYQFSNFCLNATDIMYLHSIYNEHYKMSPKLIGECESDEKYYFDKLVRLGYLKKVKNEFGRGKAYDLTEKGIGTVRGKILSDDELMTYYSRKS